jgi:hypothetical protein
MKTKRDFVVLLMTFCTGAILTALFFSYNHLNPLTTNLLQVANTNLEYFKSNILNTVHFDYATDAISEKTVNTFPGKKLSEVTYQLPCSESDINQSEDEFTQPSQGELNNSLQISNSQPTKSGLILSLAIIIFFRLSETYSDFIKRLKKAYYHRHRN